MKKDDFYSSYGTKKHSSKQVVFITYTLEKLFLAVAIFEGLWVLSF